MAESNQPDPEESAKREPKVFDGQVRNMRPEDVEKLRPILEAWIRYPGTERIIEEEVADNMAVMRSAAEGETLRHYLVAEDTNGEVIGVMGLAPLGQQMKPFARTGLPIELVHAYVAPEARDGGVGKALLHGVFETAASFGATEVMLNSGPRYKDTAWGFYNHMIGQPVTVLPDFYGPGFDAPVWSKVLDQSVPTSA